MKRVGQHHAMQFRNMIFRMPVKIISATDDLVWTAVNRKSEKGNQSLSAKASRSRRDIRRCMRVPGPRQGNISPSSPG